MENFAPVIEELEKRSKEPHDKKVSRSLSCMLKLINALEAHPVPPKVVNDQLKELKTHLGQTLNHKVLTRINRSILSKVQKELNLVTPGYYQTQWMSLGMLMFGVPVGMAIFLATNNIAFMSIGLPIGMPIGMAIGLGMDKKAQREGRALVFS